MIDWDEEENNFQLLLEVQSVDLVIIPISEGEEVFNWLEENAGK